MDDLFAEGEADVAPSPPPAEDLLAPAISGRGGAAAAASWGLLAKAPPPAEEAAPSRRRRPQELRTISCGQRRHRSLRRTINSKRLRPRPPSRQLRALATPRTELGHQTSHEGVTDKGGGARRKNARTKAKGEPASCSSCAGSATARGVESARPARIEINMTWSVGRRDTVASSCM